MANKFNVNHNNKTNIIFKKGKNLFFCGWRVGGVVLYFLL